jgi:hypothetical protein
VAAAGGGTIRVIDALILTKDADGNVEATELSDAGELGASAVLAACIPIPVADQGRHSPGIG